MPAEHDEHKASGKKAPQSKSGGSFTAARTAVGLAQQMTSWCNISAGDEQVMQSLLQRLTAIGKKPLLNNIFCCPSLLMCKVTSVEWFPPA